MGAHAVNRPLLGSTWLPREALLPLAVAAAAELEVGAPYGLGNLVGPRPPVGIVYLATAAALLWRKRFPLAVLAFVLTVQSALYLAFGASEGLGTFLPALIAFYSVGRYASTSSLVLAAPAMLLGTAVHDLKDPQFEVSGPTVFFWVILAAAWPLGQAFQRGETNAARLAARARTLELERETLAREAVAAERTRIARELHDVVGHGLSVVVLQLVAALGLLDRDDTDAARSRLLTTERSAREALAEMRRLLGLLDESDGEASLAPQPGLDQLDRLAEDTRAAGLQVELAVSGVARKLPAGIELAGFRIVQESLTNALTHARASHASVSVVYEPDAVRLEIVDDGVGPSAAAADGRGIAGMRERVALYAGELTLGPEAAGGFAVRACLPVRD